MLKYLVLGCLALALIGCGGDKAAPAGSLSVTPADSLRNKPSIPNSTLVDNPISADTKLDPAQAAQMKFEKTEHDFGTIAEGEVAEYVFKFTNSGKSPLIISEARGSCGCTVPEYPKQPIAPGESGEIRVKFDSKNKEGEQSKNVRLYANTIPNESLLTITADVKKKAE